MTRRKSNIGDRTSLVDLVKSPGKELKVSHDKETTIDIEYPAVRTVEINSFKDLQQLSLVPAQLEEGKALDAIRDDDRTALEVAESLLRRNPIPCECADPSSAGAVVVRSTDVFRALDRPDLTDAVLSESPVKSVFAREVALAYTGVRKVRHPQLAAVISDALRTQLRFDALPVRIAYGWIVRRAEFRAIDFTVLSALDVVVERNGTLRLSPDIDSLRAQEIRIFTGGRLIVQSSYIKIVCASVAGNLN
jgi:hypothetical protein